MTTIVRGHGGLASDRPVTFVPDQTVIKFFSDEDDPLTTANAIAVINSGNFGNPNQSYGPGVATGTPVDIPNYTMYARTSGEVQRDLSADLESTPILFIGDQLQPAPLHLCEGTPATCKDGVHNCTGVLGQVKDKEIVYLACRGVDGEKKAATVGIGADHDNTTVSTVLQWIDWFKATLPTNPAAVEEAWDKLDQVFQAELLTSPRVLEWSYTREAKKFKERDIFGFAAATLAGDPAEITIYEKDPDLKETLDWAREFITEWDNQTKDMASPEFAQAYLNLGDDYQHLVNTNKMIRERVTRIEAGEPELLGAQAEQGAGAYFEHDTGTSLDAYTDEDRERARDYLTDCQSRGLEGVAEFMQWAGANDGLVKSDPYIMENLPDLLIPVIVMGLESIDQAERQGKLQELSAAFAGGGTLGAYIVQRLTNAPEVTAVL